MNNESELMVRPVSVRHDFLNDYASEDIFELTGALSKAQSEMGSAVKNKTNPHFKSLYADYDSIWEACRGPLTANGLSVAHMPMRCDKDWVLVTVLFHKSGQWIRNLVPIFLSGPKSQDVGSAMTYMKRYGLSALIAIPTDEDDDGNAADAVPKIHRSGENGPVAPKQAPAPKRQEPAKQQVAGPLWKELIAVAGGNRDFLVGVINDKQIAFSEAMPPEKFQQLRQFCIDKMKERTQHVSIIK